MAHYTFLTTSPDGSIESSTTAAPAPKPTSRHAQAQRLRPAKWPRLLRIRQRAPIPTPAKLQRPECRFRRVRRARWLRSVNASIVDRWAELDAPAATARAPRAPRLDPI